jgi:hypothetical protein
MSIEAIIVVAVASVAVLIYFQLRGRAIRRANRARDLQPGRGLIDESVTAVEDVLSEFLKTDGHPRGRS